MKSAGFAVAMVANCLVLYFVTGGVGHITVLAT